MFTTNSWSKQVLVDDKYIAGGEERTEKTLIVCNRNLDLFQQKFIDSDYWPDMNPIIPFDFVCLGGVPCPRGEFYEVEYTIGGKTGVMHRALIQAVDPVTDLPLILGVLQHKGVISNGIVTHKSYLRNDIEAVRIVGCSKDEENNDYYISGGYFKPKERAHSILEKVIGKDRSFPEFESQAVCLEYYAADHCHEVWIDGKMDKFDTKPVFVCGSRNVFDPTFAEMRDEDFANIKEYLDIAFELAQDYGLQCIFCYETGNNNPETGHRTVNLMNCCTTEFASVLAKHIEYRNNENKKE